MIQEDVFVIFWWIIGYKVYNSSLQLHTHFKHLCFKDLLVFYILGESQKWWWKFDLFENNECFPYFPKEIFPSNRPFICCFASSAKLDTCDLEFRISSFCVLRLFWNSWQFDCYGLILPHFENLIEEIQSVLFPLDNQLFPFSVRYSC